MQITLTPSQQRWIQSNATELLTGGAGGAGKSHFLRVAAILWAIEIPNLQIGLFRRNVNDLQANHLEGPTSLLSLLAPYIDSGHVKYNVSQRIFRFWNGSRISLHHCQKESDVIKYQGQEFGCLLFDELTHFTHDQYKFLRSRVRIADTKDIPKKYKDCFPRIVAGSNPGGIGHAWVKKTWIDPVQPGESWQADKTDGGMTRQFLPAKLTDNPYMQKNDPEYANRLLGLGGDLARAMLDGDWNILAGGMFSDVLDTNKHLLYPHTLDPKTWRMTRTFDYGYAKPFSVVWMAQCVEDVEWRVSGNQTHKAYDIHMPRGSWIVVDEMYGCERGKEDVGVKWSPDAIAAEIRATEDRREYFINNSVADRSIFNGDVTIAHEMAVHGVNFTPSDKSPGSRARGLATIRDLLVQSSMERAEKPGLWIYNTNRDFIRVLNSVERDPNHPDDLTKSAEDHCIDAARYALTLPVKRVSTRLVTGM